MQHVDPYKSAEELGITEDEKRRLLVAAMLIENSLNFGMHHWNTCIRAHMYQEETHLMFLKYSRNLRVLFYLGPLGSHQLWKAVGVNPMSATREQAIAAINHFLVHGIES
jgi:hypothetical protein